MNQAQSREPVRRVVRMMPDGAREGKASRGGRHHPDFRFRRTIKSGWGKSYRRETFMKLMIFNINDNVRVRLTDKGRRILKEQHDELYKHIVAMGGKARDYVPKTEVDGWSRWQLWALMEAFGAETNIGFDPCFETTIVLETKC